MTDPALWKRHLAELAKRFSALRRKRAFTAAAEAAIELDVMSAFHALRRLTEAGALNDAVLDTPLPMAAFAPRLAGAGTVAAATTAMPGDGPGGLGDGGIGDRFDLNLPVAVEPTLRQFAPHVAASPLFLPVIGHMGGFRGFLIEAPPHAAAAGVSAATSAAAAPAMLHLMATRRLVTLLKTAAADEPAHAHHRHHPETRTPDDWPSLFDDGD